MVGGDGERPAGEGSRRPQVMPASLGLAVLIPPGTAADTVTVTLTCAEYVPFHPEGVKKVITGSGLQRDGFDVAVCARLVALPASTARVVVEAVRDERIGNPRPELELVWTGREAGATQTRDAGQVLPAMFARATQGVLVAGFAFYEASTLFAPLHARARDAGVAVEFFIHVDGTGHDARMTPANFFRWSWPWRDVRPTVYYDARADDGDASSTMHAKCVVIDEREALVTSASFTERAHRANIELGVLVTDRRFASRVAEQWRTLVGHGLFRAHVPS